MESEVSLKRSSRRRRREKTSSTEQDIPEVPSSTPFRDAILMVLLCSVPWCAIGLCGSGEPWTYALVSGLVGASLLLVAPRQAMPAPILIGCLLLLAVGLMSFLPVGGVIGVPEWRMRLQNEFNISTGSFWSAQPAVSLESWFMLATGVAWGFCCLTRAFTDSERRIGFRLSAVASAAFAVAALYFYYSKQVPPKLWLDGEWPWGVWFGTFPNRNAFATLCAVGVLICLAAGRREMGRGRKLWVVYFLLALAPFAALLSNTSRGGLAVFLLGLTFWMFLVVYRRGQAWRLAVAMSVILATIASFFVFGGTILKRFQARGGVVDTVVADGRVKIMSQTLEMISEYPFLGVGLGNFEPVFSQVRSHASETVRARHPESDWLWFGAEAGVLGLLVLVVCVLLVLAKFSLWRGRARGSSNNSGKRGRSDRQLRIVAGLSVFMLLISGVFDRPLHYVGLSLLALLLAGMALRPYLSSTLGLRLVNIARFPAAIFCFVVSAYWLTAADGTGFLPGGTVAAVKAHAQAVQLSNEGNYVAAIQKMTRAIESRPLRAEYYFTRASYKLQQGQSSPDVLADFARARALEPRIVTFCIHEAYQWTHRDANYAVMAWKEAILRDPGNKGQYFGEILNLSRTHPDLLPIVQIIAGTDPKLLLQFLLRQDQTTFQKHLGELLYAYPALDVFTSAEKRQLFEAWYAYGNRDELLRKLENDISYQNDGWLVLAQHKASLGDFKGACEVAFTHVKSPYVAGTARADSASLRRAFHFSPTDIARGMALYEAEKAEGLVDDALITLQKLSELPNVPLAVTYERALMLARKQDFAKAWQEVQTYLANRAQPK